MTKPKDSIVIDYQAGKLAAEFGAFDLAALTSELQALAQRVTDLETVTLQATSIVDPNDTTNTIHQWLTNGSNQTEISVSPGTEIIIRSFLQNPPASDEFFIQCEPNLVGALNIINQQNVTIQEMNSRTKLSEFPLKDLVVIFSAANDPSSTQLTFKLIRSNQVIVNPKSESEILIEAEVILNIVTVP